MFERLERIELEPLTRLTGSLQRLIRGRLWLQVLLGTLLGGLVGAALGPVTGWVAPETGEAIVGWLALPGHLFLVLIQMVVVPLVFASVVRGIAASESADHLRTIGLRAVAYFVATSIVATALGLGIALLIKPGSFLDPEAVRSAVAGPATAVGAPGELPSISQVPDRLIGLLPSNPLASIVGGEMLQVILFAGIVGAALVSLSREKSAPLFDLLGSLQEVCMIVVGWAMRLAPIAVFGLIARLAARIGVDALVGMGMYVATVLAGLALLFCVYLTLARVIAGVSPLRFLAAAKDVLFLAFSTSSSASVMPLTVRTAEEKLLVRPSTARFLIPLGATVNMDGTALYQGVATVFLAQVFGVGLTPSALVFVVVTSVAASIGSPGTPGVGIVVLAMVLEGVGIPAAGIALIIGVDRLLDMFRTTVNVAGDLTASLVIDRWLPASVSDSANPLVVPPSATTETA